MKLALAQALTLPEPPIALTPNPVAALHARLGASFDAAAVLDKAPPSYRCAEEVVDDLQPDKPVFCVRPAELRSKAARFANTFPGRSLYAVKCNPHPFVLRTLYEGGIRDFDVASLEEIELIESLFGKAGGLFFNNPAKTRSSIRAALNEHGVRFLTVDTEDEIRKVADESGRRDDLVIAVRLATRSRDARYALSAKFGAAPEETARLLRVASSAGFRVGLSFHVGSQCLAPAAFRAALQTCGEVIRAADVPVAALNVGGGFPAPYPGDEAVSLERYFGEIIVGHRDLKLSAGCLLFCEPGRSLVAESGSIIAQVLVRKDSSLYLNDGIFGNLQELRHPKERRPARVVRGKRLAARTAEFRVFGPTCDSDDMLGAPLTLPETVGEGDWIEIGMMGAYSLALQTRFNGFGLASIVRIGE